MGKSLFGGSESKSSSGFGALPQNIQGDISTVSGASRDLIRNASQYFAPMGFTDEERMAQFMINPENMGETVENYLNPYRDIYLQDIQKSMESPYAAFNQRASEAGAFGGSRMRAGQADLERARLDAIAAASANQYNQAFGQAQTGIDRLLGFGNLERGLDLAQRGALAQAFNVTTGGSGLGFLPSTSQQTSSNYGEGIFKPIAQGAGAYFAKSDIRLKKNIVRIDDGNADLPLYEFEYVWGGPKHVGHMAHEVEKYMPEAVIEIGGYKHVNYGALYGR